MPKKKTTTAEVPAPDADATVPTEILETNASVGEPIPETDEETSTDEPAREEMPQIIEASERVYFEGKHVTAVLQDGHELRNSEGKITHYHCALEDGSTAHVPVELFK